MRKGIATIYKQNIIYCKTCFMYGGEKSVEHLTRTIDFWGSVKLLWKNWLIREDRRWTQVWIIRGSSSSSSVGVLFTKKSNYLSPAVTITLTHSYSRKQQSLCIYSRRRTRSSIVNYSSFPPIVVINFWKDFLAFGFALKMSWNNLLDFIAVP